MSNAPHILADLGESRIVSELILPHFPKVKDNLPQEDDCAVIMVARKGGQLFTSDACPTPIVFEQFERDYFHYGWLTVTINASDIGSMGGTPQAMVLSVDAPQSMAITDFRRMIAGVKESARFHGVDVVGGNIRDTASFAIHAAMTGWASEAGWLNRSAARPGDYFVAFGNTGHFWLSIMLAHKHGFVSACNDDAVRDALLRPVARLRIGAALLEAGVSRCATDASDGLMGALESIAQRSGVVVEVSLDNFPLSPWARSAARELGVDGRVSALAWGDWQLVCAVPRDRITEAMDLARRFDVGSAVIGRATATGPGLVVGVSGENRVALPELVSRRFCGTSVDRGYGHWLDLVRSTWL